MTDRELLEAAAKAAGLDIDYGDCYGGYLGTDKTSGCLYFNPLKDDGAALQLAVKLRIGLEWWKNGVSAESPQHGPSGIINFDGDPYAATRRAIVRAAAAMVGEKE